MAVTMLKMDKPKSNGFATTKTVRARKRRENFARALANNSHAAFRLAVAGEHDAA